MADDDLWKRFAALSEPKKEEQPTNFSKSPNDSDLQSRMSALTAKPEGQKPPPSEEDIMNRFAALTTKPPASSTPSTSTPAYKPTPAEEAEMLVAQMTDLVALEKGSDVPFNHPNERNPTNAPQPPGQHLPPPPRSYHDETKEIFGRNMGINQNEMSSVQSTCQPEKIDHRRLDTLISDCNDILESCPQEKEKEKEKKNIFPFFHKKKKESSEKREKKRVEEVDEAEVEGVIARVMDEVSLEDGYDSP